MMRNSDLGSPIKVGGNNMIHPKEAYGTIEALERNSKYKFDNDLSRQIPIMKSA